MYTERSVELKSDFYGRYGRTSGTLYFERTGVPCTLMDSRTRMLAFALGCGIRAYGRAYGDVIKIIDSSSSKCDICFAPDGMGAQILYSRDINGLRFMDETAQYTVNKLLRRMHRGYRGQSGGLCELCDRYGSDGWCAYYDRGTISRLPLPLIKKNVILIRVGRTYRTAPDDARSRFNATEQQRIEAAADALRRCRTDTLFDMLNESERYAERLLHPTHNALYAAEAARNAEGVVAARICDIGVICISEADKTDVAVSEIGAEYEQRAGYPANILIVK